MRKNLRITVILVLLTVAAGLLYGETFSIFGMTDKDVAIYEPGEEIAFTLQVFDDGQPVDGKKITWTRTGDDGITETGEGSRIVTRMDIPGFIRIKAFAFDEDGEELTGPVGGWGPKKTGPVFFEGGACVEPEKLSPDDEPEDFDAFWLKMRAKLEELPVRAVRNEIQSPDPDVRLFEVSIACAGKRPVTGYLSVPKNASPASLPAICQFQGYGVRAPTPPGWVHPRAIVLNINAHGMELGRDPGYYLKLKEELSGYAFDAVENRNAETAYFHDMSLRVLRAVEYVKTLPEWNGKDLAANGGSQGGTQALWAAGLDADVTSSEVWSPWCCDLAGDQQGRIDGWQPDTTPALAYYDPVYHAKRIKGEVSLVANFGDYVCPPSGVWIVYNQIPHDRKSMEVKQGCTHSFTMTPHMSFTLTPDGVQDVGLKTP